MKTKNKDKNYMKKLMFATLVSTIVAGSLNAASSAEEGIVYKNLKLGDSLYLQSQADELMRPYRQKSNARDDTFYVTYQHEMTYNGEATEAGEQYTNEVGRILQSYEVVTSYATTAYLYPSCDDGYLYEPFSYTFVTGTYNNVTMDGNKITVEKPGVYTVKVSDSRGDTKTVGIPFSIKSNKVIEYVNCLDFTNENIKAAWTEFTSDLMNAEKLPDLIWNYETGDGMFTNGNYATFKVPFVWTNLSKGKCYRGGNLYPNAISPHVMATAWHYTWSHWWGGTVTLSNIVSDTTFTVHKQAPWINAKEWALANGWTEDQLKGTTLGDMALIVIDEGSIPEECCPYFTSEETLIELFGESWAQCLPYWYCGQEPSVYAFAYGDYGATDNVTYSTVCPQWVRDQTNTRGNFNFRGLVGGDSGRPKIFKWKNQLVYVGQDHGGWQAVYGEGLKVLQKFCAQYGDTLKVMEK